MKNIFKRAFKIFAIISSVIVALEIVLVGILVFSQTYGKLIPSVPSVEISKNLKKVKARLNL